MIDPPLTNDLPYCAWAALRLLREREVAYRRRMAAGTMDAQDAAGRLATGRALVDQWRWAIDPAMPPYPADAFAAEPFGATDAAIVEQLRETVAWERKRADATPGNEDLQHRALLAEALLWHQVAASYVCWPPIVAYGFAARRSPSQRYVVDPVEDERLYRELGLTLTPAKRAA